MGLPACKVADYSFNAEREQYRAICEMLKETLFQLIGSMSLRYQLQQSTIDSI